MCIEYEKTVKNFFDEIKVVFIDIISISITVTGKNQWNHSNVCVEKLETLQLILAICVYGEIGFS